MGWRSSEISWSVNIWNDLAIWALEWILMPYIHISELWRLISLTCVHFCSVFAKAPFCGFCTTSLDLIWILEFRIKETKADQNQIFDINTFNSYCLLPSDTIHDNFIGNHLNVVTQVLPKKSSHGEVFWWWRTARWLNWRLYLSRGRALLGTNLAWPHGSGSPVNYQPIIDRRGKWLALQFSHRSLVSPISMRDLRWFYMALYLIPIKKADGLIQKDIVLDVS